MGKGERGGHEYLHTADGLTGYLCSATAISVQKNTSEILLRQLFLKW